ncbi:MAG: hypothetical protein ACI4NE_06110 [Succinivibrio sp.]
MWQTKLKNHFLILVIAGLFCLCQSYYTFYKTSHSLHCCHHHQSCVICLALGAIHSEQVVPLGASLNNFICSFLIKGFYLGRLICPNFNLVKETPVSSRVKKTE